MVALLERTRFVDDDQDDTGVTDTPTVEDPPSLDPDPVPGKAARRKSRTSGRTAAPQPRRAQPRAGGKFKSRAQIAQAMSDELEMYIKMAALTWSMSDEDCAGVLSETSGAIARDLAALMARSDWIVERFETTSMLGDIVKILHTMMPLARAVYAHHIAGRNSDQSEGGDHDRVTVATDYGAPTYAPYRP